MRDGKDLNAPAAKGVSRRQFAALGAATVAAGYAGTAQAALPVQERTARVALRDGVADALFVHPAEGRHPGVVLWTDLAGLRGSAATIARDLASSGFAVLMVDPCHRGGKASAAAKVDAIDELHLNRDSKDLSAWLDRQDQVASAANGYVVRNIGPSMTAFNPNSLGARIHAGYLVAMPRGKGALSAHQQAALDRAIHATDRLAALEVHAIMAA